MLGNGHVRFGGRAGETHRAKTRQGVPVRPLHQAYLVSAGLSGMRDSPVWECWRMVRG
jgi:hypothetical protein